MDINKVKHLLGVTKSVTFWGVKYLSLSLGLSLSISLSLPPRPLNFLCKMTLRALALRSFHTF